MIIKNTEDLKRIVDNHDFIELTKLEDGDLVEIDSMVFEFVPTSEQLKPLTDKMAEYDVWYIELPNKEWKIYLDKNDMPYIDKHDEPFVYEEIDF